jgi:hypothetical protein
MLPRHSPMVFECAAGCHAPRLRGHAVLWHGRPRGTILRLLRNTDDFANELEKWHSFLRKIIGATRVGDGWLCYS